MKGLERLFGPDGLMQLLSLIPGFGLPTEPVIMMIQRLHIPGYEHARFYVNRAVSEGTIERNHPEGFYCQTQLEAALKYKEKECE